MSAQREIQLMSAVHELVGILGYLWCHKVGRPERSPSYI
jgi:hypothetical protein